MATKRMLVDATHPEETRIVVTNGNRLEEFDFESAARRQLRGNIYLAKVTRVEPSLQAAFVDYGGNRHGFLAFSEIHPDYYQIPVADREALLAAEAEEHAEEQAADDAHHGTDDDHASDDDQLDDDHTGESTIETASSDESVDDVGSGDALEEMPERKKSPPKRYKIQEVIKRRQVILVQVVKEERGNKGAALTTYLSLAGRYSVLMPNTARGGGISRKITNATDRRRLKEIAGDLEVPEGMGVILRTAGASRTKAEVKRDFEYLLRLWENVRNLTLQSTAPTLVYEEGSLIKRTIRDLYNKDIDEVLVSGELGYRDAKEFMRMIMPSHAKNVQAYKDAQPIFSKYNVESQLDSMFSPQVTLPSGGYIVINPTEALVSIDVNSGRATKEHNIEDTALQTNLEAADEVARQLRLRDLAGLIVIDFIDMMEKRSNRAVEKRLKDALRHDRARIQVGRISHFGLMEMSRQRMRFGVLESSTHVCPLCTGAGIVRSVESVALMVLRAVEDHVLRKSGQSINVRVPTEVALYILNAKRHSLTELEARYGLSITITADSKLLGAHFHIEKGEQRAGVPDVARAAISVDSTTMDEVDAAEDDEADEDSSASGESTSGDDEQPNRRRRRRGGRNRKRRDRDNGNYQADDGRSESDDSSDDDSDADGDAENTQNASDSDDEPRKRRRRGRRGGRRNRRGNGENGETSENGASDYSAQSAIEGAHEPAGEVTQAAEDLDQDSVAEHGNAEATEAADEPAAEEKPKPKRTRRKKKTDDAEVSADAASAEADGNAEAEAKPEAEAEERPKKRRTTRKKKTDDTAAEAAPAEAAPVTEEATAMVAEPVEAAPAETSEAESSRPTRAKKVVPEDGIVVTSSSAQPKEGEEEDGKPRKGGWWQRGFFG